MKLSIETWIEDRHYSPNVGELFQEAVICYRNAAYRASLLTSYIGFLTIIKDLMNRSKLPTGFLEPEWADKLKDVNNHENWENAVFDALLQGTKPKVKEIFRLNDDIKNQLGYWRSRRNDAAHYKDNEINGHHTEAFWAFIKSNVPKMAVNGGLQGLLNKFADHFDEDKTAPDTDFRPLIREIPSSILTAEYPEFFARLKSVIDNKSWHDDNVSSKVFNEIFNLPDDRVIAGLRNYFKEENRDLKFLNAFPGRIRAMDYDEIEIREIWKKRMFNKYIAINPFTIYCELLREDIVPPNEIAAANSAIFNAYDQQDYHKLPITEKDITTLVSSGFFNEVFEEAIIRQDLKKFKWTNSKCDLIAMMVEYCPLREETVASICKNPGSAWPSEWLNRKLQNLFVINPVIKQVFKDIAARKGITVPSVFN